MSHPTTNCGCEDPCKNPCICEPLTTNDVLYVGNNDVCLGIIKPMSLTQVLERLITGVNNKLSTIVSQSLVVTFPVVSCNRAARVEIVPSADAGNIFVLGSDNYPYVPDNGGGGGGGATCADIDDIFSVAPDQAQKNTILQTGYDFLAIDPTLGACTAARISPPTGFAVTGNTRESAFGSMEWYSTLTLANAAAVAGETVLIYNDTVENLIVKANVNYEGVGIHSIGNLTASNATSSSRLSNLTIVNVISNTGDKFIASNVFVTGNVTLSGTTIWSGGRFIYSGANIIQIVGDAQVSFINSDVRVALYDNGVLTNSVITDSSIASGTFAVFINNTSGNTTTKSLVSNNYISSVNNIGLHCITREDGSSSIISNNTIRTGTETGLYVHFGGTYGAVNITVTNNSVYNVGPDPAILLYDVSLTIIGIHKALNNTNIFGNSGFSIDGAGIHSVLGNMRLCSGYSINSYGILIDSQENKSSNLYIIDCTGESVNSNGLRALRDIYIAGGTYVSKLNSSAGNPIYISNTGQNGTAPNYYFIAGVKTLAFNTGAYAIKSAVAGLVARITHCTFLNENTVGAVLGIDLPNITLAAVTMDAYGNIS